MAPEKRLIDANKIKYTEYRGGGGREYPENVVTEDEIAKMPTVDAVEVVHGRWLKLSPWNHNTQSCLCLNCDNITYMRKAGVYIGKIPNYCPACGAKMDGGSNVKPSDAVEVVRCKDCKHCDPEYLHCDHPMGTTFPFPRNPDDFCSYGEREEK